MVPYRRLAQPPLFVGLYRAALCYVRVNDDTVVAKHILATGLVGAFPRSHESPSRTSSVTASGPCATAPSPGRSHSCIDKGLVAPFGQLRRSGAVVLSVLQAYLAGSRPNSAAVRLKHLKYALDGPTLKNRRYPNNFMRIVDLGRGLDCRLLGGPSVERRRVA